MFGASYAGPVLIDGVACTGNETSLLNCTRVANVTSNSTSIAGAICSTGASVLLFCVHNALRAVVVAMMACDTDVIATAPASREPSAA